MVAGLEAQYLPPAFYDASLRDDTPGFCPLRNQLTVNAFIQRAPFSPWRSFSIAVANGSCTALTDSFIDDVLYARYGVRQASKLISLVVFFFHPCLRAPGQGVPGFRVGRAPSVFFFWFLSDQLSMMQGSCFTGFPCKKGSAQIQCPVGLESV